MRIHYLQHVPFEDLGSMAPQLSSRGHELSVTHLYRGEPLPAVDGFDALIVMGGPMGVKDESRYPWLAAEKVFLHQLMTETHTPVLGVCLGAQLIADVLGAPVARNPHREIGWFPLALDPRFVASPWGGCLKNGELVFHWHGDTFALPDGALPIASSAACEHQGFIIDDRIVGLQFHLETTPQSADALLRECADELDGSAYVQSAEAIVAEPERFECINEAMGRLLDSWLTLGVSS